VDPSVKSLALLRVADSDGLMPKPAPVPLASLGMTDEVRGLFLADMGGEVAYAASYHASATAYDLVFGRGAAQPTKLASNRVPITVDARALVRMGNAVHLFYGGPGNPAGSFQVTIPDGMAPSPPRSIGPTTSYFLSGATNSAGKLNVSVASIGTGI